ncbi:DHHW family protein [Caproiciproducens sp. LBM24188]
MKLFEKGKNESRKCEPGSLAITVFLFLTILVGILYLALAPKQTFSEDENRVLESFPTVTLESVRDGSFMDSVEAFVGDHFMLRKFFVSLNTRAQLWTGRRDLASDYSKVPAEGGIYYGKDGHLYEVLLPNRTDVFQRNVSGFKIFAEKAQVPFYVLPVPSGSQEQPDKLPYSAPNHDQREELNALQTTLGQSAKVIDVFEALSDKDGQDYYYKTDHHWNSYGAYQGYRVLITEMGYSPAEQDDFDFQKASDSFYGTLYSKAILSNQQPDTVYLPVYKKAEKLSQATGNLVHDSIYWKEYLEKKDKYSVFLGGNHSVDIVKNEVQTNGKKLLILKDSYANSMVPFLATNFSEIHIIDLRYYNKDIYSYIRQNGITETAAIYSIKQLCDVLVGNRLLQR